MENSEENFDDQIAKRSGLQGFLRSNRILSFLLAASMLSWTIGMIGYASNQISFRNEKAAYEAAQKKEEIKRVADIEKKWVASEYFKWESRIDFGFKFLGGKCSSGNVTCTSFQIVTKYNCSSVDVRVDWEDKKYKLLKTSKKTLGAISSLEPMKVDLEIPYIAQVDAVNIYSITCNGKEL